VICIVKPDQALGNVAIKEVAEIKNALL